VSREEGFFPKPPHVCQPASHTEQIGIWYKYKGNQGANISKCDNDRQWSIYCFKIPVCFVGLNLVPTP